MTEFRTEWSARVQSTGRAAPRNLRNTYDTHDGTQIAQRA